MKFATVFLVLFVAVLVGIGAGSVSGMHSDASTAELIGGRTTLRVCVSVDGGTTPIDAATRLVRDGVASLNSDPGWFQIVQRPTVAAGCPRAAVLARGGTAPQANAGRPQVTVVHTPSPFFVHVYVTSATEVRRVFETLPDQIVPEEMTCSSTGTCEEVTRSLLVDDATLTNTAALSAQLQHALGLRPPTRGVRVTR
jgi:hypothetical protein